MCSFLCSSIEVEFFLEMRSIAEKEERGREGERERGREGERERGREGGRGGKGGRGRERR